MSELNEAEGIRAFHGQVRAWKREHQERFAKGIAEITNDRYLPEWEKARQGDLLREELEGEYQGRCAELVAASKSAVGKVERRVQAAQAKAVARAGEVKDAARVQALAGDYAAQLAACRSVGERVALAASFIDAAKGDADHMRAARTATMPVLDKAQRDPGTTGFAARRYMSTLRATDAAGPEVEAENAILEAAAHEQQMLFGHISGLHATISAGKPLSDWLAVFNADPSLLDAEPAPKPRRQTVGDAMFDRIAKGK